MKVKKHEKTRKMAKKCPFFRGQKKAIFDQKLPIFGLFLTKKSRNLKKFVTFFKKTTKIQFKIHQKKSQKVKKRAFLDPQKQSIFWSKNSKFY